MTLHPKFPEAMLVAADQIERLMRGITARIEEAFLDGVPAETASLTALAMVARVLHATIGPDRAAAAFRELADTVEAERPNREKQN